MAEHGRKRHGVYGVRRVYWEGARVGVKRLRRAEAWAATARKHAPTTISAKPSATARKHDLDTRGARRCDNGDAMLEWAWTYLGDAQGGPQEGEVTGGWVDGWTVAKQE